jgi:hypothetical protein
MLALQGSYKLIAATVAIPVVRFMVLVANSLKSSNGESLNFFLLRSSLSSSVAAVG